MNPPFAVNDEDVHIARTYEIAEGRWLTRSDVEGEYHIVPADYVALGNAYERVWQRPRGRVRVSKLWRQLTAGRAEEQVRRSGRAGAYPPLLYLPHAAAMFVARLFDTSVLVHLYAVRIAAMLAYVWLAFRAVLASEKLEWLFIIVGLTPMALTQAAAVSGDGLVIGLSMVSMALVGKGVLEDGLKPRALLALIVSLLALTLFKPPYVLLALALPALPSPAALRRWPSAHALWPWLFPPIVVLLGLSLHAGWLHLIRDLQGPPGSYDVGQQLAWLRVHYMEFPAILARTLFRHGDELLIEMVFVRNKISGVMRFAPALAFVLHTQLALATAWGSAVRQDTGPTRLRRLRTASFALTWLSIVLVLPTAFYVCCTVTGAPVIRVMQGRYFIPALPALLLAVSFVGRPVLSRFLRARAGLRILASLCALNVMCLLCLIGWHYYSQAAGWPF